MMQSSQMDLFCQNSEHEGSYIIGSCLFPNCEKIRPFCSTCKKEFHSDHLDSLMKFQELTIVKQQKVGELHDLIRKVEEIKQYIDSIILILQSYSLNSREINQLSIQEIHQDTQKILQINLLTDNFQSRIENLALDTMQLKKDLKSGSEMKTSKKKLEISIYRLQEILINPLIRYLLHFMSKEGNYVQNSPSKKQTTQPDEQMSALVSPKKSMFLGTKLLQLKISQYRDQRILVNKNIVSAKETGGLVLFEPQLDMESSNFQTFQLKIRNLINNFQSNVYFGICSKAFVQNSNYRPFLKELQHGCFMMDQCGNVFSSHKNSDNNFKKGFAFSAGQTIQIDIKFYTKTINWTNQVTQRSFSMSFDPRNDQYPCALINYASIEMVTQD